MEESWIKLEEGDQAVGAGGNALQQELAAQEERVAELRSRLKMKKRESPHDRLVSSSRKHGRATDKRRKVKKRHSHSGSDSGSSSSENRGEKELFGGGSASLMGLRELASQRPGALYELGLSQVARQMGLGGAGPNDPVDLAKVRMVPYLVNRLIPKFPKMSAHIERELRTACEAMDQLGEGRPAGAADA